MEIDDKVKEPVESKYDYLSIEQICKLFGGADKKLGKQCVYNWFSTKKVNWRFCNEVGKRKLYYIDDVVPDLVHYLRTGRIVK